MSFEDYLKNLVPGHEALLYTMAIKYRFTEDQIVDLINDFLNHNPSFGVLDLEKGIFTRLRQVESRSSSIETVFTKIKTKHAITLKKLNLPDTIDYFEIAKGLISSFEKLVDLKGGLRGFITSEKWESLDITNYSEEQLDEITNQLAILSHIPPEAGKIIGDPITWFNIGIISGKMKLHDEAEAFFRYTILHNYNYILAWNSLALTLKSLERLSEAEEAIRTALQFDARFAEGWTNLGIILATQARITESEDAFNKSIELEVTYAPGWSGLADLYFSLDQLDNAIYTYKIALRHGTAIESYYMLATALQKNGENKEAAENYKKTLEYEPESHFLWVKLGDCLKDEWPFEAEGAYNKAIEYKADCADAWVQLGELSFSQEEY
ncbi:MAG: tetratricopeptide repeat protein, partial [Candidatus Heimdallarchaeota archaeon]|nr:tetratricopeptide repeat protein [Candidatus Heimdallarchaeota archaeon]MCK5049465.1 tetratricopeptide repeat protein [Candidatus Heimdallarchaeota archaeon]